MLVDGADIFLKKLRDKRLRELEGLMFKTAFNASSTILGLIEDDLTCTAAGLGFRPVLRGHILSRHFNKKPLGWSAEGLSRPNWLGEADNIRTWLRAQNPSISLGWEILAGYPQPE